MLLSRMASPLALVCFALAACAPATPVATAPTPATAPHPIAQPPIVTRVPTTGVAPRAAARDWQLLDDSVDHVPGISADRAYRELLAGKSPRDTVLVAVIDGGVDTAHVDLRANLWRNPREVPGNGKDDDRNGYADDVRGWDFIGGPNGRDVHYDTFELTRLYAHCTGVQTESARAEPDMDAQRCQQISEDFNKKKSDAEQTLQQVLAVSAALTEVTAVLKQAAQTDSLTDARVTAIQSSAPDVQQARDLYLRLSARGLTPEAVEQAKEDYQSQVQYSLDPAFDPRPIVGDNYANPTQRDYGNVDVMGPDAMHGTHVSGIIGAVRNNGIGIDGIAPTVRIMMVRTVPDGDERDKDVANAIRYAVDNGARVINMSFGKPYSPFKSVVDAAVRYADAHNVLMVHAAGNDGADLSVSPNFPSPKYQGGGRAANWIEVGASSWRGGDTVAVSFSNYSHDLVDVFAPGEDILSTVPGGGYERLSGTSMAAPVVTGIAAMILAYYPQLTAGQVKRIILESATPHRDEMVLRPGSTGELVPFGSLSVTGGIVNAYNAMRLAAQTALQTTQR